MKNRNRGSAANYLGYLFGIITLIIVISSLVYIAKNRPISKVRTFSLTNLEKIEKKLTEKGWYSEDGEEVVEGSFKTLSIKNITGDIDITGWGEDHFLIKYTKSATTRVQVDKLEAQIETSGNRLTIKRYPDLKHLDPKGSISFNIFMPDTVKMISASSVSGSISLNRTHSMIKQTLRTVSGRIETGNSNDLEAQTVSGSVFFRFQGSDLEVNTVSGSIRGEMFNLSPRGSYNLTSTSGSVEIEADESLEADVMLKSITGSVSCDFPVTVISQKRNQLEGKIGDGGTLFKISTASGAIKVSKTQ
jgi:DUF4097 and DUF4098 domain-containing protein YvlB